MEIRKEIRKENDSSNNGCNEEREGRERRGGNVDGINETLNITCSLCKKIYRGRLFGGAGVGTAPPNRGCSAGVPQTEVSAPLPAPIWGLPVEMLLGCI
jgi:hypothetical protein